MHAYAVPGMSSMRMVAIVQRVTSVRERTRHWLVDAWPCLPFLACGLVGTGPAAIFQPAARAPDALAYVLVIAGALTLAPRRCPGVGLALNAAVVAVYFAAGYPYGPVLLTVPGVVYSLAATWQPRQASLVVVADFGVLLVAMFAKRVREPTSGGVVQMVGDALVWGVILSVALTLGSTVRARRLAVAGVRTEQARRVASEERLRMAQDLHDSIGHGLAAIAMQAGVALHVLDRDPQEARQAIRAVRETSREALENLRTELEGLRNLEPAGRRPTPGLEDLDRLTERVRAGGVAVHIDIKPSLAALPPAVDAAAYRIVQESLTNVLRHAGATDVRIRIRQQDEMLSLDVTDAGGSRIPGPSGGGLGIDGMRAQAEAVGGTLDAHPRPGGGFTVEARLPLSLAESWRSP
jgi:signal transduction histidine kinase